MDRADSTKALTIPHGGTVPTGPPWMRSVGLTCPGWHSRAAGVCQSQVVSPASGTHTADVGGSPDYPGDQQGRTRLIGWPQFPQEFPRGPWLPRHSSSHHTSCSELIWNCFKSQNSKEGRKETSFDVINLLPLGLLRHLL